MQGPPLVEWLLAATGATSGTLCLMRSNAVCAPGSAERRTARAEAVMGLGMALMAAPVTVLGKQAWGPPSLAVVFAALTVRTLFFARGESHRGHHTLDAAAMVYMTVAMATAAGSMQTDSMAGMGTMSDTGSGGMGIPLVNGLLMGYYAIYASWAGVRLLLPLPAVATAGGGPRAAAGDGRLFHAPEVGVACRISMAIGMLVMLMMM